MADSSLAHFDPLIRRWMTERIGNPTTIQSHAWPLIATGEHVLLSAPTGSGKTLAGFLWAINQLLTGTWTSEEGSAVLYVSPLKALNTDIRRNLSEPLSELENLFDAGGRSSPDIRVLTRSGDTPAPERRRMVRTPPDILITTPESLNLLLSSPRARGILGALRCVILDEIHAVAGTKRGTHLMTAVERLTLQAGEFQRIAMSATVNPLERVAAFVGGFRRTGVEPGEVPGDVPDDVPGHLPGDVPDDVPGHVPADVPRSVRIVRDKQPRHARLSVCGTEATDRQELWSKLIARFREVIGRNRSTLFFTTNRRHAERIALLLNEAYGENVVYAHHGSLSREVRSYVEHELKHGRLRAIIATTSLELGIDVGEIEEVGLVGTPLTIASTVQMVGRSGHRVGRESRGTVFPLHGRDYLDAAVMSRAAGEFRVEAVEPPRSPLDVLCQVIISMTSMESWDADELFAFFRRTYSFRDLDRSRFDSVINMLTGHYSSANVRELDPRVIHDPATGTIVARKGSRSLLYHSGGTIPDRGYYTMRVAGSGTRAGELDEEFVWERKVGDVFVLGSQAWEVVSISSRDVTVRPAGDRSQAVPFWRAEPLHKSFAFQERALELLERINRAADADSARAMLATEYALDEAALSRLLEFLDEQRRVTGRDLPDRHHLLLEHYTDPDQGEDMAYAIVHTLWGGRVNHPFALLVARVAASRLGYRPDVYVDNDCVLLRFRTQEDAAVMKSLIRSELPLSAAAISRALRAELEQTGLFGARFRENSARALLLPRSGFNRRTPLWLSRLRAKKLFDAVASFDDFPLVVETWRSLLEDDFELDTLLGLLEELHAGELLVSECETSMPSPFARNVMWQQTNYEVYLDDTPEGGRTSGLAERTIREAIRFPSLRPPMSTEAVEEYQMVLQRTKPGYAPREAAELRQWISDRIAIPLPEWRTLVADLPEDAPAAIALSDGSLGTEETRLPGGNTPVVTTPEARSRIENARAGTELSMEEIVSQWLRYYGPVHEGFVADVFGFTPDETSELLDALEAEDGVVRDIAYPGPEDRAVCDFENFEHLLRRIRRARRPALAPLGKELLPWFLAAHQGLTDRADTYEGFLERLDELAGFADHAELWESAFLPARSDYRPEWLDRAIGEEEFLWVGAEERRLTFIPPSLLELAMPEAASRAEPSASQERSTAETDAVPDRPGRYSLHDLAMLERRTEAELAERVWEAAWKAQITADSFRPVRRAAAGHFRSAGPGTGEGDRRTGEQDDNAAGQSGDRAFPDSRRRPVGRSRSVGRTRRASRPASAGHWFALRQHPQVQATESDPLSQAELGKDRARLLLQRYGIVFRDLLANEPPALRWRSVFDSLRLLELSGEAVSGHFFASVPGPQFLDPALLPDLDAFRRMEEEDHPVFWLSARDPASPCGLETHAGLPSRLGSSYMVFHGPHLVVVTQRQSRHCTIHVEPDDARLPDYVDFLRVFAHRRVNPDTRVVVESINGQRPEGSPYLWAFERLGFRKERRGIVYWAPYR